MSLPGYIVVRVNDDEVVDRSQAFDSFQWHIDNGLYLTRTTSGDTGVEVGQKLIGAGTYGGRGLVIFGTVTGTWEPWTEPFSRYKRSIAVKWEPGVYALFIQGLEGNRRLPLSAAQYQALRSQARRTTRRDQDVG
jgi:hypothetical protein